MICGTRTALNTPPATNRKIRLGRLLALMNVSLTVEPRPKAAASIQVLPKPRKRDTSVPAAMMALERASPGWTALESAEPDGTGAGLADDIVFIVSPGRGISRYRGPGPAALWHFQPSSGRTSLARSAMRRSLGKDNLRASSWMGTH